MFSVTERIKKTEGVFEIFSVNLKFQFDFTDEITDKILKIIIFNCSLEIPSVKPNIKAIRAQQTFNLFSLLLSS